MTAVLDELEGLLREVAPKHLAYELDRYDAESIDADVYEEDYEGSGFCDSKSLLVHINTETNEWDAAQESRALKAAMLFARAVNALPALLAVARAADEWAEARGDNNETVMRLIAAVRALRASKAGEP